MMTAIREQEFADKRNLILIVFAAGVIIVVLSTLFFVTLPQVVDAGDSPPLREHSTPTTVVVPYTPPLSHYEQGLQYLESGQYEQALLSFTHAIAETPDHADLYARRGNVYLAVNRLDQAAQDFERATLLTRQLARDGWLISYRQGETARDEGRYADAIHNFTQSIQLAPSNYILYYERAEIYDQSGYSQYAAADYAQVVNILTSMILGDFNNAELYRRRAVVYQKLGETSAALADWLKVVELIPDDPKSYRSVGLFYVQLSQFEQALPHFEYAMQLAPQNAASYADIGWLYGRMGDYDWAINYYSHALTLDPALCWRRLERADIFLKQQHDEQAIVDYTFLLDFHRDDLDSNGSLAKVYNRRAWAYAVQGHYDLAVSDYWQATIAEPDGDTFFRPYFELGVDLPGERDLLIGFYERILALNAADGVVAQRLADLYANRGQEYYFVGDFNSAIADYSRLKQLEPLVSLMIQDADHALATVYYRRAQLYEQTGEKANAVNDYLRAVEHGHYTAEMVLRLGDLYFELNDRSNALAYYEYYVQLGGAAPNYVLERLTHLRVQ